MGPDELETQVDVMLAEVKPQSTVHDISRVSLFKQRPTWPQKVQYLWAPWNPDMRLQGLAHDLHPQLIVETGKKAKKTSLEGFRIERHENNRERKELCSRMCAANSSRGILIRIDGAASSKSSYLLIDMLLDLIPHVAGTNSHVWRSLMLPAFCHCPLD